MGSSHAQRVLDMAVFNDGFDDATPPVTLDEMDHRLSVITDAIRFLQNKKSNSNALKKRAQSWMTWGHLWRVKLKDRIQEKSSILMMFFRITR
jgi:hypothetical protein